jgi:hypothetical protein
MTKARSGAADLIRSALGVYRVCVKGPTARGKEASAATSEARRFHLPTFAAIVRTGQALPGDPEECEASPEDSD